MTSHLSDVKVFTTGPHGCGYLPGREATTLFLDPATPVDAPLYNQLSQIGFRRSGSHLYRPHCTRCKACVPARIPIARFQPRGSQKRTWQRNRKLLVSEVENISSGEYFDLYQRYIENRHRDGDMYPPLREQYDSFLTDAWGMTRYFRIELDGMLLGVIVTDQTPQSLSAIYTFFDPAPEQARRSLGTYAILWLIELARQLGLSYLYLGYWIRDCRKMAYKSEFRPLQLYRNGLWVTLPHANGGLGGGPMADIEKDSEGLSGTAAQQLESAPGK